MAINPLDAVSAYKKGGGLNSLGGGGVASSAAGGQDFGSMVQGFMGDAIQSLHAGEKAAADAATGKADLASVVTAMDNAEIVLTEITAIRDKVIEAYKTITSGTI